MESVKKELDTMQVVEEEKTQHTPNPVLDNDNVPKSLGDITIEVDEESSFVKMVKDLSEKNVQDESIVKKEEKIEQELVPDTPRKKIKVGKYH